MQIVVKQKVLLKDICFSRRSHKSVWRSRNLRVLLLLLFTGVLYLSPGTEILTVQAADNDDPKTDNVRIFYRLVGQIPESPRALFRVDRDSGVISVQADSMEGTAPQYTLTITAEDAKGESVYNMCAKYNLPYSFVVSLTKKDTCAV